MGAVEMGLMGGAGLCQQYLRKSTEKHFLDYKD